MKKLPLNRRNVCILALVLMSLALRIVYAYFAITSRMYLEGDAMGYVEPAMSLYNGGDFYFENCFRTPGYPFVILLGLVLCHSYYYIFVIALQHAVYFVAGYSLYKCLLYFDIKARYMYLVMVIYLFNIQSIYFNSVLLTDGIFQSGVIIVLYLWFTFWKKGSRRSLLLCALLIGLLSLVRPIMMYLAICLGIGLVVVQVIIRKKKELLCLCVAFVIIAEAPVLGWCVRNYVETGDFVYSSVSASNMYVYYGASVEAELTGENPYTVYEERDQYLESIDYDFDDPKVIEDGREMVKNNFGTYLKLHLKGMIYELFYPGTVDALKVNTHFDDDIQQIKSLLYGSDDAQAGVTGIIKGIFNMPVYSLVSVAVIAFEILFLLMLTLLTVIFVVKKYRCIDWAEKLSMIGILLYFWTFGGFPFGIGTYPRFRMPFFYIEIICACILLNEHWHRAKGGKRKEEIAMKGSVAK